MSHIGHNHLFLGFCKDVGIIIEGLKIKYSIFVIEQKDHDLVLSQPFLNLIKFSQEYKLYGIFALLPTYILNNQRFFKPWHLKIQLTKPIIKFLHSL